MTAKYNFMKHRKLFFAISLVLVVFILGFAVIFGVPMDIQFKGGAMVVLGYEGEPDMKDVQSIISGVFGDRKSVV